MPGRETAAVAIGRSKQHHDVVVDDDGDKDVGDDDGDKDVVVDDDGDIDVGDDDVVQKTQQHGVNNVNNVNNVPPSP